MALTIVTERSQQDLTAKLFTLTERTVISKDGTRVIVEGKEDGRLLGPAGSRIPEAQAIALGLLKTADAAPEPAAKAQDPAKIEDKAVSETDVEDKAGKKPAKKGKR